MASCHVKRALGSESTVNMPHLRLHDVDAEIFKH
jgi:hypothetical protein